MEDKEIWKDIPGYEGLYQASSFGRFKSLERIVKHSNRVCVRSEKIKLGGLAKGDIYRRVVIGDNKHYGVHQLVAMCFLDHVPDGMNIVVDHIDDNTLNNRLDNLQIISNRDNLVKSIDKSKTKSNFTGVFPSGNKWRSRIQIGRDIFRLGTYNTPEEASDAYQKKLSEISGR